MRDREPPARITCLVNPCAANSRWTRRRFLRAYLRKKLPGRICDLSGDPSTTVANARRACRDSDVVLAMGGDGTVADALRGIFDAGREKEVVFGVIPFGTGNAFRKAFGIPRNPVRAIDGAARGISRWTDLLEIEGRVGGFASVGATADVTGEKVRSNVPGVWGFLRAARKLYGPTPGAKEIVLLDGTDEDGPFERKTLRSDFFDLVIAKTGYFGYGWKIAPRARPDDGFMDITLFEIGPVKYTLLFPLLYLGLLQGRFRHFKARGVIVSGRDLPVQFHGEFLGLRDRIEARLIPRAIRILCPDRPEPGPSGR